MAKRYDIFTVKEPAQQGGKAYWTKIGAAFENRDGVSFSIVLDALPVNGKMQMRLPQERQEGGRNDGGF